jgi:hypothetical protein
MDWQARILTVLLLAVVAGCSHGPGWAGAERSVELMHAKLSISIARRDQSDWATPDPQLDGVSAVLGRFSAPFAPSSRAG